MRLENPGLDAWKPEFRGERGRWRTTPAEGYDLLALPTGFFTAIYDKVERPRTTIGRVRRGAALSVRKADTTITCYDNGERGEWYEVEGGGVLCSTSGFDFVERADPLDPPQKDPKVDRSMPFQYARVIVDGAPRVRRQPSLAEWEALAAIGGPKDDPSGLMIERMIGDFFVSLNGPVEVGDLQLTRTVHNEYVETKALKPRPEPNMVGERLGNGRTLPIAFVWGEDEIDVLCAGTEQPCGVAEKHARFFPRGTATVNGERYVKAPNGILVPARSVRVLEQRKRPGGVGPTDKWVHIDLARQGLVAYEGDTPVYATVISSGKEGHDTPTGLYRIQRKYLSKTMRAVDPKEGLYHIEDIPWTMYYYGAYAVHGAFWHDVFGQTRSHGCTNLAPADARWIYHWSDPKVPDGWHAIENIEKGTAFFFSNDA
ncbi:MAG TPA: L,D-transpeptidase [Polyangiaceae bacterium LLY-WYZ-14_1]|nr:L,D-transpeptidase [Polyangiaceae bacterium LLY-WYZ-14_1]